MKGLFLSIGLAVLISSCASSSGSGSSSQTNTQTASAEALAKDLTGKMKATLGLDKTQEDRVFAINVVNQKLIQRSRQNNDAALATSTKENYHKELKEVLSEQQFSKFLTSFPNL